jgi:hypothetical protein
VDDAMNTRIGRFIGGLLCAGIGGFILLVTNIALYPPSGLQLKDFVADMVERAPFALLFVVMFILAGCVLMIWGVVSRDPTPIRPDPVQLDFARANLEPWNKPAQAETDAVTRPDCSDIQ